MIYNNGVITKGTTNMENKELQNKLSTYTKGTFIKMEYKSNPTPLAAHKGDLIEKVSKGVYRLGITYANMKVNANRITGPLKSGQWRNGLENYIIDSVDKKGIQKSKLRVYTTKHKTITKWFLNGVETTKQWLIDNGYISSAQSGPRLCFDVLIDNIISIG